MAGSQRWPIVATVVTGRVGRGSFKVSLSSLLADLCRAFSVGSYVEVLFRDVSHCYCDEYRLDQ